MAQKFTVPITVKQLSSAGSDAVSLFVDGDTNARLKLEAGGKLVWGSGSATGDVNLYRDEADVLKTDDTFKAPALFVDGIEIDTTGASTNQVLKYNGTKFAPAADATGAGSGSLDDLTDVVITSPEEYQTLEYDGTGWINKHASLVSYVRNVDTVTLGVGTCVYLFGATGDHSTVKRADNTTDATSSKTVGLMGVSTTANNNGPVITRGYVDGINLTAYAPGDILWLGKNGAFTKTKPTSPDHLVFIGVVVRATNNGIVYVATQNGYELDELHNVSLSGTTAGQLLAYDGTLWKNTNTVGSLTIDTAGTLVFEGATADGFETTVTVTDPTADRTITLPNATGTVALLGSIALGSDTTGNYISDVSAGTGITITHTPGEGSTPTIAVTANTYQPLDSELTALAALTSAADKLPYFTGAGTANTTDFTTFGRSLVDDADASTARTTLGLAIGTNVQAYNSTLAAVAAGTYSGDDSITTVGTVTTGTWSASTIAVDKGGTGQTSYTDGQLLIGNTATSGLSKATLTGTTNQVTVTNGNGTITLSLPSSINVNTTGSAATLTTARAIYGNNFDGSAALTQAIAGTYGGTGVNNGSSTITVSGNTTIGSSTHTVAFATSANTSVTLPTTGTLATLAGSESLTNKKLGSLTTAGLVTTSGGDGTLSVTTMGTGIATFLGTPSSANLASAVTDETGSGALVFGTSPAITTSLTTPSTTFSLLNTTATTINFGGGATTEVNIGNASGTVSVPGRLLRDGNRSAAAWGVIGVAFNSGSSTFTNTSTAASGTVANAMINTFGTPTIAATNSNVTATNSATVYINAAPTAGTNMTLTNRYAMFVNSGSVKVDETASFIEVGTDQSTGIADNNTTSIGVRLSGSGAIWASRNNGTLLVLNRMQHTAGQALVDLRTNGATKGTITENAGTVSYNAFLGSHYTEIDSEAPLLGTVMESTGVLVDGWLSDQSRLPKCKVSDTAGSTAVFGIYFGEHFEEDVANGHLVASLGAAWVRMASGSTPALGDLIESNGDGCARVQEDTIIRSSTIGKLSSTTPAETYEDGSYLLPCVLYCG